MHQRQCPPVQEGRKVSLLPSRRICLVASGKLPIPPQGWGAVENVIWNTRLGLEAVGWQVDILNLNRKWVAWELLRRRLTGRSYDWIYVHNEMALPSLARVEGLLRAKLVSLSHSGFADPASIPGTKWFRRLTACRRHISLTAELADALRRHDDSFLVEQLPNGVEIDRFRFYPAGNGRAICLGQIGARKRQARLADALSRGPDCDFVGPNDPKAEPRDLLGDDPRHLGSWTREEVYERLGAYSALVLFSESEAQPLVILEALACGLSVVGSPEALRGIDLSLPFVHRVEDIALVPEALRRALAENPGLRESARQHAEENFAWSVVVQRLVATLDRWTVN
ncbi:MAG: glycosyltransferase family 4 protein [Fimbriimonas sp.]